MTIDHEFLVLMSKTLGLFYLLLLSLVIVVYTYWPSNKKRFDKAAQAPLEDEDPPCR